MRAVAGRVTQRELTCCRAGSRLEVYEQGAPLPLEKPSVSFTEFIPQCIRFPTVCWQYVDIQLMLVFVALDPAKLAYQPNSFLNKSLRTFSVHRHIFCEQRQFISCSLICMPFFSFSCFIALDIASRSMLKVSNRSSNVALFQILEENSLSPMSMTSAIGFSQMPFVRLRKFPSVFSLFQVFSHK